MGYTGLEIRMNRIMYNGKTVTIPMDHGISIGPKKGLYDIRKTVDLVAEGGANAVLLHKGIIRSVFSKKGSEKRRNIGVIMHISGSTDLGPDPNNKVPVANVEEAIKYGADAVSVHINIGSKTEDKQLEFLGYVAGKCEDWEMPLLAMMYPRGPIPVNRYIKSLEKNLNSLSQKELEEAKKASQSYVENVKHAARVAVEAGAHIVKTNYTGSSETFEEVVRGCCNVPVIVAGGSKLKKLDYLKNVEGAIKAGASGVAGGRNVFKDENPTVLVQALCGIVHDGLTAEKAFEKYNLK